MSYITEMDMNAAPAPLCASLLSFAIELPHLRVFRPTFLDHVMLYSGSSALFTAALALRSRSLVVAWCVFVCCSHLPLDESLSH